MSQQGADPETFDCDANMLQDPGPQSLKIVLAYCISSLCL